LALNTNQSITMSIKFTYCVSNSSCTFIQTYWTSFFTAIHTQHWSLVLQGAVVVVIIW